MSGSFRILHLNIRSVIAHYEELEALMHFLDYPDVVCLTETWLNESNQHLYSLNKYEGYHYVRPKKSGGAYLFTFELIIMLLSLAASL